MTSILVVDDSAMVRQQVSRALTAGGFAVLHAADGLAAIDQLAAEPGIQLVVCDVSMPRMNGLEFLEHLVTVGNKVQVVMLTTEGQPDLIEKAKKLGAKAWLVKPFKPDLLLAAVRKLTT